MTQPRVGFVIGGAMKCGTSALSAYLASHPRIALPRVKEAHVFDAVDFDEGWDRAAIDARYADHFASDDPALLYGDDTPIYMFHPRFVERIHRYNPAMRWIVLLRDPVDRAISQHHMQHTRKIEPLGLFGAAWAEPARLRGDSDPLAPRSAMRRWSYAERSRYARQLDLLHRFFPAQRILVLRSRDLALRTEDTVARALDFLGLDPHEHPPYPPVFEGGYAPPGAWHPGRLLLHWRLRGEIRELRQRYGIDLDAD